MDPTKSAPPDQAAAPVVEELFLDLKQVERVKEIMLTFSNAVSAMKIFPSDHASVKNFVEDLSRKLLDFLAEFKKLQIGVEDYQFTYLGKQVFKDEISARSLPFFFSKDGMQLLSFYQGLTREEIIDFLEIIKLESRKSPEESDVINAMWEREFTNIQYFSPDEYLEQRIIHERLESLGREGINILPWELSNQVMDFKVDKAKIESGRLELRDEDREAVSQAGPGITTDATGTGTTEKSSGEKAHDEMTADELAGMTGKETSEIETLLQGNRSISSEEEFLDLIVEVLYLEEDKTQVKPSLDVFLDFHFEQVQLGAFDNAIRIIRRLDELRAHFVETAPEKATYLTEFLYKVTGDQSIAAIREFFKSKPSAIDPSFFDFMKLLGPSGFVLAAELFEEFPSPEFRTGVLDFLREPGLRDPGLLASLSNDSRPNFTKEAIHFLANFPERRATPHFAVFTNFQTKEIRLEAVWALGRIKDDVSNRILFAFLNDPDEEVRIEAALKISTLSDRNKIIQLLQTAKSRDFRKKRLPEKRAILVFLGRARTEETFAFLKKTLRKFTLVGNPSTIEMKMCAAAGLAAMATPEARELLEKGARARFQKVRDACQKALDDMDYATPGRT